MADNENKSNSNENLAAPADISAASNDNEEKNQQPENVSESGDSKKSLDWTTIVMLIIVLANIGIYLHSVNRDYDNHEDEQLAGEPPAQTEPAANTSAGSDDNDRPAPGSGNKNVPPGSGGKNNHSNDKHSPFSPPGPDPAPRGGTSSEQALTPPPPQDLTSALATAKGQAALEALQKEKGTIQLTDDQKKRIEKVLASQKKFRELGAGVVAITSILTKDQLAWLRSNKDKLTDARFKDGNPISNALQNIKSKAADGVPQAIRRPSTAPEFNPETISVGIMLLEQSNMALDANQAASIAKYLESMEKATSGDQETLDDIINNKQRAYLEEVLDMRDSKSSVQPKEKGDNAHV